MVFKIKKNKNSIKHNKLNRVIFGIVFCIFALYTFYLLYPLAFALNSSLKADGRAFIRDTVGFSIPPYFKNYILAFKQLKIADHGFFSMTFNSIWYAGGSTLISILVSALTAYVVCKYKFRGRGFIYALAIFIMIIPVYGSLPARYRLYSQLGFINSPLILIASAGGLDFAFLIIYSFFKNISWNYAEAAFIDGAGHYRVLFTIMLPMALPAITAITITSFIGAWNSVEGPLLYLPDMPTIAAGLWMYERKIQYTADQPVYFAGALLSLLPAVTIFAIFQNTIMQNVYAGGLKG